MTIDVIIGEKVSHIVFDGTKHCVEHVRASLAAVPASEPAQQLQDDFGQKVTDIIGEIRKAKSLAWRDSLVEELIELIEPSPPTGAVPAPVSGMPDRQMQNAIDGIARVIEQDRAAGGRLFLLLDNDIATIRASLPAAPAPTDRSDRDIDAAEKLASLYDSDDRQDIKTDVMNSFYAGLRYERTAQKAPAPTEQAGELLSLPQPMKILVERPHGAFQMPYYNESQMQDYARTALARQLSRIRHLEHERDIARKDCAAIAARQAPTSVPRIDYDLLKLTLEQTQERLRQADEFIARQAPDSRDAARYRWLRDKSDPGICAFYLSVGKAFDGVKFNQDTVDCAIDAQISAQEKAQ